MEKKLKVYAVGHTQDLDWMIPYGFEKTMFYKDADIVVFPGGGDWEPSLYGEVEGKYTYAHESTDKIQLKYALDCIRDRKFMIGICRGAQMLCILNGGKLIQHVTKHAGDRHAIKTIDGNILETNSLHHQMLDLWSIPSADAYTVLGYGAPISTTYLDGQNKEKLFPSGALYREQLEYEPEIVYFNEIGGFGVQGHPEMYSMPQVTNDFIITNIKKYYNEFSKKKKTILPEYVNIRIEFIRNYHFQIKKLSNVESKKDRDTMLQVSRDWTY